MKPSNHSHSGSLGKAFSHIASRSHTRASVQRPTVKESGVPSQQPSCRTRRHSWEAWGDRKSAESDGSAGGNNQE